MMLVESPSRLQRRIDPALIDLDRS